MFRLSPRVHSARLVMVASMSIVSATACTGLAAGPESNAQTPVPVSRDTAWARARRALSSEAFTLDVVDSTGGHLIGTRYTSANARQGTQAACRVRLALGIRGDAAQSELNTTSRWIASETMLDQAPQVCDHERTEVLERITTTIVPPTAQ
jgi:hypothetical protein